MSQYCENCKEMADQLAAAKQQIASLQLAIDGVPDTLLHRDWYGGRQWAENIRHVKTPKG